MERNKETVVWTSVYEERGIKGGVGWLVSSKGMALVNLSFFSFLFAFARGDYRNLILQS